MENARLTIQLGNSTGTSVAPQMATFEEAFGEYSNLKGKGRAKRAAKRTDRREAKVARKTEKFATKDAIKRGKVETRQNRRSDRKAGRVELRQGRRADRKQGRQDIRANQQASRMARRMERTDQRQSRKDEKTQRELDRELAAQDQLAPEENYYNEAEQGEGVGEYGSEGGGVYEDGGYAQDGNYDDGGYDDAGYDDGGYDDGGYDDAGYDDAGYDDAGYDDAGYDDGYGDDVYNYDEDYGDDGYYDSFDTSMFEGESDMDSVIKPAQEIADKIEWNRKFISKLGQARNNSVNPETIDNEIVKRNERVEELKSCMDNYCCFEGDYENDFSSADGRNTPSPRQIRSRMKIASVAKMRAKRKAGTQPKQKTVVSKRLDPTITGGRIVIPAAMSGIDGLPENTGMIATDDYDDYGYGTQLDIQLGADGSKSKIPMKNILIGVAVGAIVIFALKKYKVI